MKDKYLIQSVVRAIDVLEQFNVIDNEFSISQLADYTGLNKNTVFRLLLTLQSKQFIETSSLTGKFKLGIKTFELAQTAIKQQKQINHSRSVLEQLKKQCHETTAYSVLKQDSTYCIDGVESDLTVRVANMMGGMFPLHCTAGGKAHIAYLDDNHLQHWINSNELRKYSPNTIIDPEKLKEELHKIFLQGYAIEDQEFESGVGGIAAPVKNLNDKVIGAVGISLPAYRINHERMRCELIPLVIWAGKELSSKFLTTSQ